MRVTVILPAAGKGIRFRSRKSKLLTPINGRPLIVYTLKNLKRACPSAEFFLASRRSEVKVFERVLKKHGLGRIQVVAGGKTRAESVRKSILCASSENSWVLIHDAARPLPSRSMIRRVLSAARRTGAALAAMPATATVKKIRPNGNSVLRTEDRSTLVLAQTPQVFRKDLLLRRYRVMGQRALKCTDEAALFDGTKVSVRVVPGDSWNVKVTTREDLEQVKSILRNKKNAL